MEKKEYYDPWSNTKTKHGIDADLVISALQKCIRRADEYTATRMAYELYITSTFHEEKMWNRLIVISVEDIGFGNTEAPVFVKTMYDLHKHYNYGDGDRTIFFIHAIRYLCKCKKERSTDNLKNVIMKENERGILPEIPDVAIDMHTIKGRERGRDVFYFLDEASKVMPLWEDYDDSYRQEYYKWCQKELEEEAQENAKEDK